MKKNKFDLFRKASMGGSIIAAISASLCCIGPLVAVLLGASGFAAAGFFSKWRPALLTVTFALLALAWFLTYRKPKAACADGSCATTSRFAWSKVILWIATASVLVAASFPALSSAVLQAKQGATCCMSAGSCDTSTTSLQPKSPATETINTNLVSFYRVPLVCPAAPEIGCGSASKPLLLELEQAKAVSEAWLNRAGTIMAVVWSGQSTAEQRAGTVNTFQKESQMALNELTGRAKQQTLNEFESGSGWYRGAQVDRLSEEEAGIIAARLVRRVQAKTTVPPEKAAAFQRTMTEALKKRFTDDKAKQEQNALLKSGDGWQQFVGEYLDKEQIPILMEAIASGFRQLPGEK
jgi:hypothetical protein